MAADKGDAQEQAAQLAADLAAARQELQVRAPPSIPALLLLLLLDMCTLSQLVGRCHIPSYDSLAASSTLPHAGCWHCGRCGLIRSSGGSGCFDWV